MTKILTLAFLFVTSLLHGQAYLKTNSNAGSIPTDPSSAAMTKMSQATVNHSTGIPDISYPAGTLQGRTIAVPVTFVYDASGRKVNEDDGIIGWGWNLMAGGTIVRNIVGQYDEVRCVGLQTRPNNDSDLDGNYTWNEWDGSQPSWVIEVPDNFDTQGEHNSIAENAYYFQPDEYTFTLPDGRSGTFVISEEGEAVLIPYMALTIEFDEHYYGFTITDDAGIKFIFNTRTISYTSSPTEANVYDNQTSEEVGSFTAWYLDEIQNPYGDIEFSFEYVDKGFDQTEETFWSTKYFSHPDVPVAFLQAFSDLETTYISHSQQKRLVNIHSILGSSVEFGYPDDDDLEVVTFFDNAGEENYHLSLTKGVFEAQNTADNRLKLSNVKLIDRELTSEQTTSFEYDDNGGLPFPARNSNAYDHWGYFNGLIEPNLTIPSVNGTIRRVDIDYNQMGILTTVKSPNGSIVIYEYETNTYSTSPDGSVSLSSYDLNTSRIFTSSVTADGDDFYQLDDNSSREFTGCDCSISYNGQLPLCCSVQMAPDNCDYGYTFYNPNNHSPNNENGFDNVFELSDHDDVDHPWNPNNQDDNSLETIYSPSIESRIITNSFFLEFDQDVTLTGSISKSNWTSHLNIIQIFNSSNIVVWSKTSNANSAVIISEPLTLPRGHYTITSKVYYPRFTEVAQSSNQQIAFPLNAQIGSDQIATLSIQYLVKNIYPSASEKFGGGLRVKQTIVSDGDGDVTNNTHTKFTYDDFTTGISSGHLLSDPKYECQIPYFFNYYKGCNSEEPCFQSNFTFYTGAGINQILTANGSFVIYRNVRTEICSNNICNNGWVEEEFSVLASSNSNPILNNKTQYKKWRSGLSLATRLFDANGNKISIETNAYSQIQTSADIVKSAFAGVSSIDYKSHNLSVTCGNMDYHCLNDNPIVMYSGLIVNYESELFVLSSSSFRTYDQLDQNKWMESSTLYEFNSTVEGLPSRVLKQTNDPDYPYTGELFKYVGDYVVTGGGDEMTSALNYLQNTAHFGSGMMVETVELKGNSPTTMQVCGGRINTQKLQNNRLVQDAIFDLELPHVFCESDYIQSNVISGVFQFNPNYRKISHTIEYTANGQVIGAQVENDIPRAYLRDYTDERVVADIMNAIPSECAYTSFETDNGGGWQYDNDNVINTTIAFLGFVLPDARTGTSTFQSMNDEIIREITQGDYTLSFWSKGDDFLITGLGISATQLVSETNVSNGWSYWEYHLDYQDFASTTLSLSSENGYIDELRLYPSDALMSTTCYNSNGTIASTCSANNYCNYYLYDALNRKEWVLDDKLQIVSRHTYHIKDLTDLSDYTWQKDQVVMEESLTKSQVENASPGNSSIRTTIKYFDGLGRVIESIGVRESPNGRDVVNFHKYDSFGREPRLFAPCTANIGNDGDFIPISNLLNRQLDFYDNTSKVVHTEFPFADVEFEPSPANRVLKQGHFGESWQITTTPGVIGNDHVNKTQHLLNSDNEVLDWNILPFEYSAMSNHVPSGPVYYPANSLRKSKVINEEGQVYIEFINQLGQVICKRSRGMVTGTGEALYTHDESKGEHPNSSQPTSPPELPWSANLDTYFLYDDFGRMVLEIPPIAVVNCSEDYTISTTSSGTNNGIFEGFTTWRRYDRRGRLILEKNPGEETNEYVYNNLNKLVMLRSPALGTNKWKFIKYDIQGRTIQTGIVDDTQNQPTLQTYFNNNPAPIWETKEFGDLSYSNYSYPIISEEDLHSETYYDNYFFDLNNFDFANIGVIEEQGKRTKGLMTGVKTRVFEYPSTAHFIKRVNYFDTRGRELVTVEENILGGYDKIQNYYDYTGLVTDTKRTHLRTAQSNELIILNYFEYDHMGRPKLTWQKIDNDQWVALFKLVYNELGQVVNKHLHLTTGTNTGMQIIDYRYNERGWLTKINNADLSNDGDNDQAYDVFGEELIYFEEDRFESDDMDMIPKFDGNTGAMKWKTNMTFTGDAEDMEDGTQLPGHSYTFRYDDFGQLVASYYASSSDIDPCNYTYRKHLWDEKANYDVNGNILNMQRWRENMGVASYSDNLRMNYMTDSNKLIKVIDYADDNWSTDYSHFVDQSNVVDYEYDQEGRLTRDHNKQFEYQYNHLDLVTEVNFESESITFAWDAMGRKLSKTYGSQIVYYMGGIEYVNDQLSLIATSEGIARRSEIPGMADDWVYDYYLKDHLGNVRAVITEEQSEIVTEKVTSEIAKRLEEEEAFDNVGQTAEAAPYMYPYDPIDPNNLIVSELNAYGGEIIGPAKLMAVNKGEQIDVSTNYWYQELPSENPLTSLSEILAGVILNLATASSGIIPSGPETGMALINNVNGAPFGALSNFLDDAFEDVDLSLPQAYMVYMYFDIETMTIEPKNSGVVQVGVANQLGMLTRSEIIPSKDGFFYVYVTNRSQLPVNFDNLTVKRWKPMVRASYDYYPYGLTWDNPADQSIDEGVHDCTYQDKEFQFNEFGNGVGMMLHDFQARMYDGTTGRWLVPDPAKQFSNPYLAMGNNPIMNEDPDGRFINQIFDAMEYVSPIVIRPLAHTGTDQRGFGWEVSIGIPKMYGFSYRWEYGRVKYKKGFGDKSGTEVYKGGEVTYFGMMSFGGKRYQGDYGDGEFTQTTGTVTIGVPFASVRYENDIMPWTDSMLGFIDKANIGLTPSFDKGDRYRSAGLEMNVFGLSWGFQLFTGDPGFKDSQRFSVDRGDGKFVYTPGLPGTDPDKYREGILYFGVGPFRFGRNCEANRHKIQNQLAHDNKVIQKNPRKTVPWFQITQAPNKRYFYFGTGGGLGVY